jgi:hypothetical protein
VVAHALVHRLVLIVKIATMLGYTTEDQRSVVRFCGQKWLNANDMHKEMFPVYGGKCLSRKAVHSWVTNSSLMTKRLKRRGGSGWDNAQKDFYAAGFDALVKRWDKCINIGGGYVKKYFSPVSNITCFTFYIRLWLIHWLFLVMTIWVALSGFEEDTFIYDLVLSDIM